jgi:ferredoxin
VCPTAAIRPIGLDEKIGKNAFADKGPIRIGTAFVDRGRCLPWSMDRPCIVCQENCPVSPKAIFTREQFQTVSFEKAIHIQTADADRLELDDDVLEAGRYASGDYYCTVQGQPYGRPRLIRENYSRVIFLSPELSWKTIPETGSRVQIMIRLLQPFVDPERCIGCGICEHECPVIGKRAIRVTADNETRSKKHALIV